MPEALVTGGGRGIGAAIAERLAAQGWNVTVAARGAASIEDVARRIGGRALTVDVRDRDSVAELVAAAGAVDLLVANAGIDGPRAPSWEIDPEDWWDVFRVNVLGVHLCCSAVIPGMLERGRGRIVITGSGVAYMPRWGTTHYAPSKAAICRYGENLADELRDRIPVFTFSPGLVRTELTVPNVADFSPGVPPEVAAEYVAALASGRYDALAGLFLHAVQDDLDDVLERIDEVRARDLQAIRLQR
jgi:3-oxoacyl-[acyl-carrier protein] reductase